MRIGRILRAGYWRNSNREIGILYKRLLILARDSRRKLVSFTIIIMNIIIGKEFRKLRGDDD